jgi:DNA-binding LacI/PurR family transcriptional regulator
MAEAGLAPQFLALPADPITPEQTLNDRRVPVARDFLANAKPRPTAAIAYELAEAMAVLHASHQLQIRIPDEFSLLMFHPGPEQRICIPVTTVSNAVQRVGQEAVRMLMEKIDHPGLTLPARAVPMELIEGGTCLPPQRKDTA